jgi:ABC-type bacteriocin/lantibiotic exporter with double-glycine peptidase domain
VFFNHLQHLTVRFFDEHRVGEVMSRFQDIRTSFQTVSSIFDTIMTSGTFLVLVPPLLLFMNFKLALISLTVVPLTTVVSTVSSHWVRRFSKQNMEESAELSAFQFESLSHIRTLKGMAAEHFVYRSANERLHRAVRVQLASSALSSVVGLINAALRAAGQAVFSWYAWSAILHQEMSLGDFVAFTAYMGYLTGPVTQFASLFVGFQTSAVSFGRMFEYLELPVEQEPALAFEASPPIKHRLTGDITISDVRFRYTPDKEVLHGLTLHISRGSLNAIVGPSGAGKSSLLRLLCRMEEPHAGQIWFGDIPITSVSLPDIRRQIAVVWQEFSLMRGTVLENLTYGLDDVPRERVDDAIRVARLTELVADLPHGVDTTVAEWGSTLSGGQRQRMAIARALIRDAPILLLDEATSNIDVQTESEVLRDVFSRLEDKTVVYVTHRVATAALADRICVIDNGRLIGSGTHDQLMEQNEFYRNSYLAGTASIDDPRRLRIVGGEILTMRR